MSDTTTIAAFVARVRAELADVPEVEREDVLVELESLLAADAQRRGEAAAVAALGDPADYAGQMRAALVAGVRTSDPAEPQGRVLGMPYDFRGVSVDRISARIWNPSDPRILTPRLFGVGWTVNFGAIAVKLGMIRPDDLGDESFERIPKRAADVALAVPVLIAVATSVLLALSWSRLPARVPVHWGVSGAPDGWASKAVALGAILALTVVPVAVSVASLLVRRSPARSRMLAAAALALLSSLGLGLGAITVADARGGASGNLILLVIVGSVVLSFLLLYVPSRLGLRAEWREASGSSNERKS